MGNYIWSASGALLIPSSLKPLALRRLKAAAPFDRGDGKALHAAASLDEALDAFSYRTYLAADGDVVFVEQKWDLKDTWVGTLECVFKEVHCCGAPGSRIRATNEGYGASFEQDLLDSDTSAEQERLVSATALACLVAAHASDAERARAATVLALDARAWVYAPIWSRLDDLDWYGELESEELDTFLEQQRRYEERSNIASSPASLILSIAEVANGVLLKTEMSPIGELLHAVRAQEDRPSMIEDG